MFRQWGPGDVSICCPVPRSLRRVSTRQSWASCQVLACHSSHIEEAGETDSFEGLGRYEFAGIGKPYFILLLKGSEIDGWLKG